MPERIPQSVTRRVELKAFLASDHVSAATGKTIAIKISKNGGAFADPSAGATNATEIGNGWYYVDLSTTDTGTTGPLIVRGTEATIDDCEERLRVASAHNAGFDGVPDVVAAGDGGLPTADAANGVLLSVGTSTGQLDVSGGKAPATVASNDGVDAAAALAIVNSGSFGNSALLSAIQNVQNNTFIATSIPQMLEVPDSGSATVSISVVFSDETGAAKNLDSGDPTLTLVNDAGVDKSARLGTWSNPATGKYTIDYTNTTGDTLEGLHWDLSGTINSKLRRMVAYTQLVDTTAVDFTSSDRTNLNTAVSDLTSIVAKLPTGNIGDATAANQTTIITDIGLCQQAGAAVTLPANPPAGFLVSASFASSCDFTTTQKTSLNAATPAVTVSDKTGFALAANGIDLIVVETGLNARQAIAICSAASAGVLAGALTTTVTIAAAGVPATTRISATVDLAGNRSAVTLTPPA